MTDSPTIKIQEPYPNFIQSVILIFSIHFFFLLFQFLIKLTGTYIIKKQDFTVPDFVFQIVYVIVFTSVILFARYKSAISISSLFKLKPENRTTLIIIPLLMIGLSIVFSEGENLFRQFFNHSLTNNNSILFSKSVNGFLTGCILGPVLEEILFRGIVVKGFLKRYNPAFTIFLSSLVFGMAYTQPSLMIGAFFFGLFLSWISIKNGSLICPIWAHISTNIISFVLSLNILPYIRGFSEPPHGSETQGIHQPILFTISGLVLSAICVYFLVKNSGKETQP